MNEQMTMSELLGDDDYISEKDAEKAEEERERITKARNNVAALIDDTLKRYRKEKTRARSKKAAEERDAYLASPKFNALKEYDKRDDIQEAYGWDYITAGERDRLEELWDERERIKNSTFDGVYVDEVTKILGECFAVAMEYKEKELSEAERKIKKFKEARGETEQTYSI